MNLIPFYGTQSSNIKDLVINKEYESIYKNNDKYISQYKEEVSRIFVAWGNKNSFYSKFYKDRVKEVFKLLKEKQLYYTNKTKEGNPKHPSRGGWPKKIGNSYWKKWQIK